MGLPVRCDRQAFSATAGVVGKPRDSMPKETNADGGVVAGVPRQPDGARQTEMRHARSEIAALRNRVDANEVCIEEVVLLINELREQMEARSAAMDGDRRPLRASARDHGEKPAGPARGYRGQEVAS
jgi:hypothetical protein